MQCTSVVGLEGDQVGFDPHSGARRWPMAITSAGQEKWAKIGLGV